MKLAAQIISFIFHPLLLPTWLVALLCYFFPPLLMIRQESVWLVIGFIFVFTFVLPIVNLVVFKVMGTIQSFHLTTRKERIIPFAMIAIFYGMVSYLFYTKLQMGSSFNKVILIIFLLVLTSLLLTFFYKVSVHSLAMWGGVGILLPLNKVTVEPVLLLPVIAVIILSGLVTSARLALDAHTPRETLVGSIAGFAVGFFGMLVLFRFV